MTHPMSLRSRLLLALMLMTLLTLGVASGLSALLDLRLVRGQIERDLQVLTSVVGQSCVSALVFDSRESAEQRLATLSGEYQIQAATLYDADGRPFARWRRDGPEPRPASAPAASQDGARLEIEQALTFDGRPIGRLVVSARLSELARQVRLYWWLVAAVALVTLTLALVVALHLLRRIAWPITTLQSSMREVTERGDFSVRVPELAAGREIDALACGFNRMLGRIEQRDNELREANRTLRRLANDLSQIEEGEKARLSGELHDGPMQSLALAQIQIEAAISDAQARDADPEETRARFGAGIQLLREGIGELRTLQFELSPPLLHDRGLAAALDWLAGDTRERWGIDLSCHIGADLPPLGRRQTALLYRCARELVNNIIKHADARGGRIELDVRDAALELTVSDDGRGFDAAAAGAEPESEPDSGPAAWAAKAGRPHPARGGYGLCSIRERLALLGGGLDVTSGPDGSRLRVRLPLGRAPVAPGAVDGFGQPPDHDPRKGS